MSLTSFLYKNKEGAILGALWGFIGLFFTVFTTNSFYKYTVFFPSTLAASTFGGDLFANPIGSLLMTVFIGMILGIFIDHLWQKQK